MTPADRASPLVVSGLDVTGDGLLPGGGEGGGVSVPTAIDGAGSRDDGCMSRQRTTRPPSPCT